MSFEEYFKTRLDVIESAVYKYRNLVNHVRLIIEPIVVLFARNLPIFREAYEKAKLAGVEITPENIDEVANLLDMAILKKFRPYNLWSNEHLFLQSLDVPKELYYILYYSEIDYIKKQCLDGSNELLHSKKISDVIAREHDALELTRIKRNRFIHGKRLFTKDVAKKFKNGKFEKSEEVAFIVGKTIKIFEKNIFNECSKLLKRLSNAEIDVNKKRNFHQSLTSWKCRMETYSTDDFTVKQIRFPHTVPPQTFHCKQFRSDKYKKFLNNRNVKVVKKHMNKTLKNIEHINDLMTCIISLMNEILSNNKQSLLNLATLKDNSHLDAISQIQNIELQNNTLIKIILGLQAQLFDRYLLIAKQECGIGEHPLKQLLTNDEQINHIKVYRKHIFHVYDPCISTIDLETAYKNYLNTFCSADSFSFLHSFYHYIQK